MHRSHIGLVIDNAAECWEMGFCYLADMVNPILRAHKVYRLGSPIQWDGTFSTIRNRFLNAISGLRSVALDLSPDSDIEPWSFGYVNSRTNPLYLLGGAACTSDAQVIEVFRFMLGRTEREYWDDCISGGMTEHATKWRNQFMNWRLNLPVDQPTDSNPEPVPVPVAIAAEKTQDKSENNRQRLPDNKDVLDLCQLLERNRVAIQSGKQTEIGVAREFTKEPVGNCPKADGFLRQARRYGHLWK